MALIAAFQAVLANAAANGVLTHARKAWSRLPWSRDAKKVNEIERRIARLVDEAGDLARSVSPESVDGHVDRLLNGLVQDLVADGISQEDAQLVRDSVRAELRATVLNPLQDLIRVQRRLEGLERETLDQGKRLQVQEADLARAAEETRRLRARVDLLQTVCAIAVTLSLVAALLVIVRR